MYNRIMRHLEKFYTITSLAFTQMIIALTVYPCSVFLDLCNAFDTVDHQILLANLEYKGMQDVANDWFVSYLSNRRQFVSLFQRNCDYQTVACRVPQGSVLSPLLTK